MERISARDESKPLVTWRLRGGAYVAVSEEARRGLSRLDQDRANSMTDEGGPPPPSGVANGGPAEQAG